VIVRRVGAATAVLALAAACSTSSHVATTSTPTTTGSGGATTTATATTTAALARFYGQKLAWRACGDGFSCSRLLVPLDYAHPSGATMRVAVIRTRAIGSRRGSLIVNPGGPGASGVDFVRQAAFAFDALNTHLDIVGFDPRGVGASRPIRCLSPAGLDRFFHTDPEPRTAATRARLIAISRQFADACWQRNGGYLAHVGTIDAARDMDVLRAALGDRKLTYYGASYGTYLGAKYAQLFPTRIRAMVLDGAVNPAENTVASDIGQSKGFETNLDDFLRWCVRHGSCPLGSTVSAAQQGLDRLEAKVRTHPEPVGARSLGPGEFFIGLASGFYATSEWPGLRAALAAVKRGDGSRLLAFADSLTERRHDGSYSNLMESNMAINCVDRESPTSVAGFDAAAQRAETASPHFGLDILYSSLPCAFWHVPPVERAHPVRAPGAAPILVVGTTHDPATPYVDAQALAAQLGAAGRLVTLAGDGHTAYLRGDACIERLLNAYLLSARVPRGSLRCG
jgi:pimeloyl-ACP methyl ester carboxylesterase